MWVAGVLWSTLQRQRASQQPVHRSDSQFGGLGIEGEHRTRRLMNLRKEALETELTAASASPSSLAAIVWQGVHWTRSEMGGNELLRYTLADLFQWIRSEFAPQAVYGWRMLTRLLRTPPSQLVQEARQNTGSNNADSSTDPKDIRYEGFLELLRRMRIWMALRDALRSRNRNISESALTCLEALLERFFDGELFDFVDELVFEDDVNQIGSDYDAGALLDFWACMEPLNRKGRVNDDDHNSSDSETPPREAAEPGLDPPGADPNWAVELLSTGLLSMMLEFVHEKYRHNAIGHQAAMALYFLLWVTHPYLQLPEAADILTRLLSLALELLEPEPLEKSQVEDRIGGSSSDTLLTAQVCILRASVLLAMDERLMVNERVRFALQRILSTFVNTHPRDEGKVRKLLRSLQALVLILERNQLVTASTRGSELGT
ncbi:hypothetical protein F1559_003900 [Cyanidiococcus yangmingshanensis]|uniref:Uncharacterized protein n=1 Tax=Cyanidiococcus yangmingshanensis TaxID=2690220 RepID=A0A7J7ILE5_9RHOD|nr:hypothetical protein F1559_003900 [Cyanidiococcus yangmingshanensis]